MGGTLDKGQGSQLAAIGEFWTHNDGVALLCFEQSNDLSIVPS
jgi:hypothetical protein